MNANIPSKSGAAKRAAVAVVAFGILTGASGLAAAGAPLSNVPAVVVRYADLDLGSEQGARTLYRRILGAAEAVCPQADIRDLERSVQSHRCRQQAVARAVQNVSSPQLAAIYAAGPKRG
jgi:UrcA family protein